MKIKLTTNFSFQIQNSNALQRLTPGSTIKDLLACMDVNLTLIENDNIEILLNNKEIWFYPEGLKTRIKDGDSVDITFTPLGGG